MTKTNLYAYLAGFLDGEGTFSVSKPNKACSQNYARITCPQVVSPESLKIMNLLKKTFRGCFIIRKPSGKNQRDYYLWRISNRRASFCAQTLLPFLIIKKPQAKLLIEIQSRVTKQEWKKKPRIRSNHRSVGKHYSKITEFKKGHSPYPHRPDCKCFRCTKISPRYNPLLPKQEKDSNLLLVTKMRILNKRGKN